jgi:hypothetical protein
VDKATPRIVEMLRFRKQFQVDRIMEEIKNGLQPWVGLTSLTPSLHAHPPQWYQVRHKLVDTSLLLTHQHHHHLSFIHFCHSRFTLNNKSGVPPPRYHPAIHAPHAAHARHGQQLPVLHRLVWCLGHKEIRC